MDENVEKLSSNLMLNIVQKEYEYEVERNKGIQSKSGIFISLIGVMITLFSNLMSLKEIFNRANQTIGQTALVLFYLLLVFTVLLGLILALILFAITLNTQKYKRLNTTGFNDENVKYKDEIVALEIMKDYRIVLEHNIKVNDNKAKVFKRAYIILTVCIIIIPIILFIKTFI